MVQFYKNVISSIINLAPFRLIGKLKNERRKKIQNVQKINLIINVFSILRSKRNANFKSYN